MYVYIKNFSVPELLDNSGLHQRTQVNKLHMPAGIQNNKHSSFHTFHYQLLKN